MMQFTRRERLLGLGLTAAIAVWGLYTLAIKPTRARIRTLQRVIPEKQTELRQLRAKSAEYLTLQKKSQELQAKLASQSPDFQLLPFLEAVIERHKLTSHVVTMQPPQAGYSQVVVTLELQDIPYRQLVGFLVAVESSEAVLQVGSLHVRQDATNELLVDATVGIYSPRPARQTSDAQLAQNRQSDSLP
jgi:type II secretory pathway component PulM